MKNYKTALVQFVAIVCLALLAPQAGAKDENTRAIQEA